MGQVHSLDGLLVGKKVIYWAFMAVCSVPLKQFASVDLNLSFRGWIFTNTFGLGFCGLILMLCIAALSWTMFHQRKPKGRKSYESRSKPKLNRFDDFTSISLLFFRTCSMHQTEKPVERSCGTRSNSTNWFIFLRIPFEQPHQLLRQMRGLVQSQTCI